MEDIVVVGEGYAGGAPKALSGTCNPPGKACDKPMVFVVAARHGQARATSVPDDKRVTLGPVLHERIVPESTTPMTDGSTSYTGVGQTVADHHAVIHSQKQYTVPETGARVNTAEAVSSNIQRAVVSAPWWVSITPSAANTCSAISTRSPGDGTTVRPNGSS